MKNLILTTLIILLISLVACGKPSDEQEEPVTEEVTVDFIETLVAHQNLLQRHEELEALYERAQLREVEYIAIVQMLSEENRALQTALALTQSLGANRQEELKSALNELLTLREEKKEWGRFAEQEYEQLMENYNKISALFPPTHFSSDKELIEWRANTGNVTELGCLGLQELALADGYIVSAHPDLEYCVVIAGDFWYRITSGEKDLVEKIRRVKK